MNDPMQATPKMWCDAHNQEGDMWCSLSMEEGVACDMRFTILVEVDEEVYDQIGRGKTDWRTNERST